jgi:hypothetical protein
MLHISEMNAAEGKAFASFADNKKLCVLCVSAVNVFNVSVISCRVAHAGAALRLRSAPALAANNR